jgi:hypothetical protein
LYIQVENACVRRQPRLGAITVNKNASQDVELTFTEKRILAMTPIRAARTRLGTIRAWRKGGDNGQNMLLDAHQNALAEAGRLFATPDDPYARARNERALLNERRKKRTGSRGYDLRRHMALERLVREDDGSGR